MTAAVTIETSGLGTDQRQKFRVFDGLAWLGIAVGIALRWILLSGKSFWFDEGITTWLIALSPAQLIRCIRNDVSAPLYFLSLRYWAFVFGTSEAALRSMSAAFATGSLLLFYLLARRVLRKPLAVAVAVWLFALTPFQIEYAKEARYYAMLSFLLLLALYCLVRYLNTSSRSAFAGIVLASATALYTHNAALFYFAALNVIWLILPSATPLWRRLLDLLLADLLVGAIYAPWVPVLIQQNAWANRNFWADKPRWHELSWVLGQIVAARPFPFKDWLNEFYHSQFWDAEIVSIAVFWIATIVIGIGAGVQRFGRVVAALSFYAFVPILGVFLKSRYGTPIFMGRIFIASATVIPLLLAIPLAADLNRWVKAQVGLLLTVLLFVAGASAYLYSTGEPHEDWRGVYKYVAAQPREGTLLVFVANEGQLPFDFYALKDHTQSIKFARTGCPQGFIELDPPQTVRRVLSDDDITPLKTAVSSGQYRQIILIYAHEWFSDPNRLAESYLNRHCELVEDRAFNLVHVYRYAAPAQPANLPQAQ